MPDAAEAMDQVPVGDALLAVILGEGVERMAVERDLVFFHGFQQRALRLGRSTVDFIRQHQLRKDGAALKAEAARLAIVDGNAQYVRGQQIAGELNALEGQPQSLGDCMRQGGLADAGNVLDQQVSFRQEAGQAQPDLRILAQDYLIDLCKNRFDLRVRHIHWSFSLVTRAV